MSDLRNASLVLKSNVLTRNSTTAVGECNAGNTSFTWYGINLRTLLGDMYDDYDLFNLCLNSMCLTFTAGACFNGNEDRSLMVNISGLPFINQTYNQATGHNNNAVPIASMVLVSQNNNYLPFYSNNIAMFGKNQDMCDISISFTRVLDNAIPVPTATVFPQCVFLFDIIGVVQENMKRNTPKLYLPSYGH